MIRSRQERKIGLEYEFLGIQLENGFAVTRDIMKAIWRDFADQDHVELLTDPGTQQPIGVTYIQQDGQEIIINTDAGINIIEFGFLPYAALEESYEQLQAVIADFLVVAKRHGAALLAYGLQPKTPYYYPDLKSEKIWYRGYVRFPEFADGHHMFHNIAANQPCIDITYDELIPVVNSLNALAGVTIGLFANSGWGEYKKQEQHEVREYRWDTWMENPVEHQKLSGIPSAPFKSFKDYIAYNWDIRLPAAHRGKTMHVIDPAPQIDEYMRGRTWESFDVGATEPSTITPSMEDANLSNMYIWIQARPKYYFSEDSNLQDFLSAYDAGTEQFNEYAKEHLDKLYIEVRNIACQPWEHMLTAPAFILGLVENIDEVQKIVAERTWDYWTALRKETIIDSLAVEGLDVLAKRVVDLAVDGLKKRGMGEEKYVDVLYERIAKKQSPAQQAIAYAESEGVEALIQQHIVQPRSVQ